jgi:hypothetical protein
MSAFGQNVYFLSDAQNACFVTDRTARRAAPRPRIQPFTHSRYMKNTQHLLDLSPRTKLRLSEIERMLKAYRIIVPPPCRTKLLEMCEDGTLETVERRSVREPWLVYEDSFIKWLKGLDGND